MSDEAVEAMADVECSHYFADWSLGSGLCPDCGEAPEASMTCRHGGYRNVGSHAWVSRCICGEPVYSDAPQITGEREQRRHIESMKVDALTKPRTAECPECGPMRAAAFELHEPCPSCSGSGTVTRGPIAVLVPPDAVEIMARAVGAKRSARPDDAWALVPEMETALDALYRRTGEATEPARDRIADGRGPGYPVGEG